MIIRSLMLIWNRWGGRGVRRLKDHGRMRGEGTCWRVLLYVGMPANRNLRRGWKARERASESRVRKGRAQKVDSLARAATLGQNTFPLAVSIPSTTIYSITTSQLP
mgnify:CR=1 FL=1